MEHIFWALTPCFNWYQKYGDLVVFDTTYKVNAYDMPFGIFVDINNHGKTIFFGCALLQNEKNLCFSMVNEGMLFILKICTSISLFYLIN